MSEKQILLVKHSWSYASGNPEEVDKHMFKQLSQIAPEAKAVFNPMTQQVGQTFAGVINLIVLKFQKPAELCNDLKAMAKKHPHLQAMAENYDTLVIAFLMTMKKMLGNVWTNETRDAWAMAFATINHKMDRTTFTE